MNITATPPSHHGTKPPARQVTWFAKDPEERFESATAMLASVDIPKQGLPARELATTHGSASLSFTAAKAAAGAMRGVAFGAAGSLIVGLVANLSSENMFGPILGTIITTTAVATVALPAGAVVGGVAGAVVAQVQGETTEESRRGRLMRDEQVAVFYPDAGTPPETLGAYPPR